MFVLPIMGIMLTCALRGIFAAVVLLWFCRALLLESALNIIVAISVI